MRTWQSPTKNEVLTQLFERWQPQVATEQLPVDQALGRVTAEAMHSQHTLPVMRISAMDGIAVRSSDFRHGDPDTSSWVEGKDYVRADTGDDFADGFDAVIQIENVTFTENGSVQLTPGLGVVPGYKLRLPGSTIKEGEYLIGQHLPLRTIDLVNLTLGGVQTVPVIKKPVVAFIPTGSELIPPGVTPARGQSIDTNSLLVAGMLREMGAEPLCYPIVRDDQNQLAAALDKALNQADIVIINGGSSKGGEDFNARLLKSHGEVLCHGVAAAPGRPMCVAVINGKPVINLPGPTLAAFYGLDWCLRGLVCHYLHIPPQQRQKVRAVLTADLDCGKSIAFLAKLALSRDGSGTYLATPRRFSSHSEAQMINADGVFISPIGEDHYPQGSVIEVELLRGEAFF